ncbi:MAG: uroporphyrinogen decarboxylase [Alphaproteobacteria bacterium]|nr:uroporphyrinogen decarboxylase [Alphaproteobacteria bacterium]
MTESDKLILQALRGVKTERPPFWYMRQAGRYLPEYRELRAGAGGFLDFCFSPGLAVEATLQPVRRFHTDAAILFSDILVIPWALGQAVAFKDGVGPVLDGFDSVAATARLKEDGAVERLAPVLETVSRLGPELADDVALIGFAGAPWTVATYMVEGGASKDFARVREWTYRDGDGFQALIDVLVRTTAAYLVAQIKAGAEAVQIFDSWAGVLPEDGFRRWVIAPTAAIVEAVKGTAPTVPVIGFPRGAGMMYEAYVRGTGVDAVGLDTAVPVSWAADVLQPLVPVQGNLDPIQVVTGGPAMIETTARIVDGFSGGAHIFNLGHGFVPATPPEHVAALSDYLRGLGAEP